MTKFLTILSLIPKTIASEPMLIYICSITFIMVLDFILFLTIDRNIAILMSNLLNVLCVLGFLFYAVFFQSAKRWPNTKWYNRLIRIMTFDLIIKK